MPAADENLWDVARAAQFLGMSVSWTYRAAETGVLPYRRVGSRLRFVPSELRDWVNAQAQQRLVG